MKLAGKLDDYRFPGEDLPLYAWPGGYAIAYVMDDGGTLCGKCVNDPTNPVHTRAEEDNGDGWRIDGYITSDYREEDDSWQCDHCHADIL